MKEHPISADELNSSSPAAHRLSPLVFSIVGPQLFSLLTVLFAQGVLTVQVFLYFTAFPKDRLYLKYLVYGVYFLEAIQSVVLIQSCWVTYINSFFDPISLNNIGLLWISLLTGGIVTCSVQCYYAYRISIFGKSLFRIVPRAEGSAIVAILIVVLACVQFGASIALAVATYKAKHFNALLPRIRVHTAIWNGAGVACDFFITVSMTFLLYRSRVSGTQKTQRFIQRLIRVTIETGTFTAIVALLNLFNVELVKQPSFLRGVISAVSNAILSKIYANALMVVLNSRTHLSSTPQCIDWNTTPASNPSYGLDTINSGLRWDSSGDTTKDTFHTAEHGDSSARTAADIDFVTA